MTGIWRKETEVSEWTQDRVRKQTLGARQAGDAAARVEQGDIDKDQG
jgi:hypothetical protein